ncbi:hypothetical protein OKA06_13420 [Novosphingobium sp. MW5]|nr:hypothetical protein [Novosphingobium sp. MW5]
MSGPREMAIGLAKMVLIGPNPLDIEFRGMPAAHAGEMIALLAQELKNAEIIVGSVKLPAEWLEQALLRISDPDFRAKLALGDKEGTVRIYRED